MAWGAAGFEFGGDGALRLFVRRVVVEFEQVCAPAIDTLVVVGFENDTFLACRGVTPAI